MDLLVASSLRRKAEQRQDSTVAFEPAYVSHSSLCEFIRTMRTEPATEFQTRDAAASFGVSPFTFIRAFKKLTGLSPQRFRAALRIELAKRLLVETDRPVTEISFDVGYNSLGTFVRTFSALVGVSPGQLRRLARGGPACEILADGLGGAPRPTNLSRLYASIQQPMPPGTMVAAGLFPQGFPAGLPFDGCFVDPAAPDFRLVWPPGRRRACLLAAAVGPVSLHDAWAGRLSEIHVSSLSVPSRSCDRRDSSIALRLRPLEESDPPFLTPVPLLMLIQSRRA